MLAVGAFTSTTTTCFGTEAMSQRQPRSVRIAWARIDARWERQERLGQMLAEMPKNTGAKGVGPIAVPSGNHNAPTLASVGIDL